jgi:hypothetical protein
MQAGQVQANFFDQCNTLPAAYLLTEITRNITIRLEIGIIYALSYGG